MILPPLCNTIEELDAMQVPLAVLTPAQVTTAIQDARVAHTYRAIFQEILDAMEKHDLGSVSREFIEHAILCRMPGA